MIFIIRSGNAAQLWRLGQAQSRKLAVTFMNTPLPIPKTEMSLALFPDGSGPTPLDQPFHYHNP